MTNTERHPKAPISNPPMGKPITDVTCPEAAKRLSTLPEQINDRIIAYQRGEFGLLELPN